MMSVRQEATLANQGDANLGRGRGGGKVGSLAVGVWLLALSSSEIWLR